MQCKKCSFNGNPHLVETGPHTKALCPECGSYIKMTTKQERETITDTTSQSSAHQYATASDMIKSAIDHGYRHIGGNSLACKHCKEKASVRKFVKNMYVTFACHKCGARW